MLLFFWQFISINRLITYIILEVILLYEYYQNREGNYMRLNNDYIVYTVKMNDNIYSIARKYNTTVDEIMKLNNLKTNVLDIGQTIKVPVTDNETKPLTKTAFIDYIVKSGDSLYKLAKKYNITVNDIMKDNNLSSPILSIGQVIKIRLGAKTYDTIECYHDPSIMPEGEFATYVVKPGDTLFKIARNYNKTIDELMEMNNLSSPELTVGQIIKIMEL